ncbi:MAG: hypothetical protein AMXMBFR84_18700 [Candidatus Hydrogenedentota bacterium]
MNMKRSAVIIGVDKVHGMALLHDAAAGAMAFADWASSQAIDVDLLTDSGGSNVTVAQVKSTVKRIVDSQTYDQLIIYFAGHGICKQPGTELWLLSGATEDSNEAINLSGSSWQARNARINHIVFISDACRTPASNPLLSQIFGSIIFPNAVALPQRPALDFFYATLPWQPAIEVPEPEAAQQYRAVFTSDLLKGLRGEIVYVVLKEDNGPTGNAVWKVTSDSVKPFLIEHVPLTASGYDIRLQQFPEIIVESRPPTYLSLFDAAPAADPAFDVPEAGSPCPSDIMCSLQAETFFHQSMQPSLYSPEIRDVAMRSKMAARISEIERAKGRESFETRTGFSVVGSRIARAVVSRSSWDMFEENGAQHIRVHNENLEDQPRSALIQIEFGKVVPLAVLPGFIGTIVADGPRVLSISYLPSRGSSRYPQHNPDLLDDVRRRNASASVAAESGHFRFETEVLAIQAADMLRESKGIDPMLGLYSAYAYAQAGKFEEVHSVFEIMHREPEPVLYDVAMLAGKLLPGLGESPRAAPFCPMLAQGWWLIEATGTELNDWAQHARSLLLPGLWTTLDAERVADLWTSVERD